MNTQELKAILSVKKEDIKMSGQKRLASVKEALSWPTGKSQDKKIYQEIWSNKIYKIKLGKPGKEAASDYDRCKYKDGHKGNNPNDMKPTIWNSRGLIDKSASFVDINDELQILVRSNENILELLACLLFRSAFMIDHVDIGKSRWRYDPSGKIVNLINKYTDPIYGVPIEVFLHYLDALAWNEDVKYHTLGYDITKDTGRKNNLLTCVNLIGVFLARVPISKFSGNLSRPPVGVSPISKKKAFEIFPLLRPEDEISE